MTWGALKDQVKTPSLKQTEPSRPGMKKRRREEDEDERAEAGLGEGRGGRGGRAVRRYATLCTTPRWVRGQRTPQL